MTGNDAWRDDLVLCWVSKCSQDETSTRRPDFVDIRRKGDAEFQASDWSWLDLYRWDGMTCSSPPAKTRDQRGLWIFVHFNMLVVRDGIDPQDAHRAFLKVKEYRQMISRDMEGAEDQ